MARRLYLATTSFVADPAKVRLAIGVIALTLAAASLLVPGLATLAGGGGGGTHPNP